MYRNFFTSTVVALTVLRAQGEASSTWNSYLVSTGHSTPDRCIFGDMSPHFEVTVTQGTWFLGQRKTGCLVQNNKREKPHKCGSYGNKVRNES